MAYRCFVTNVENALAFYVGHLGFEKVEQWGPAFAVIRLGDQEVWLSGPGTSAAQPMPDGKVPGPGGWNRVIVPVSNLSGFSAELSAKGVEFLGEIISGPGGSQLLIKDPDGNPVELFEGR